MVEYALMLALIAVMATTAIRGLGGGSSDSLETAGGTLSTLATAAPSGGGGGGGGGGSATTVSPTATVAPATTVAPTTSAAPTTIAAPSGIEFTSAVGVRDGGNWTAYSTLVVRSTSGQPVPGALVTMKVRRYQQMTNDSSSKQWIEGTVVLTANASGQVSSSAGPYKRSGKDSVDQVQFVVMSASMPAGYEWNGNAPTVTVDKA